MGEADYTVRSCREFVSLLASSEPVPGGGGAAAIVGAVGTALGMMVGSLTVGKKRYAEVEDAIRALMEESRVLMSELLDQVEADAEGFRPLAQAYSVAKDDPERERVLEEAARRATEVPLHIMELCAKSIETAAVYARDGSRLAVSDAGCAAVCLKAALEAASLNVYINTKMMKDRSYAKRLNSRVEGLLEKYGAMADEIYAGVRETLLV